MAKVIADATCAEGLDALLSDRPLTVSTLAGEVGRRDPRSLKRSERGDLVAQPSLRTAGIPALA